MTKEIRIQDHVMVPKHVKLEKEEISLLLSKYNVSIKQLPRMSKSDPAIRDMEVQPGDVIKITRKSPTAGISNFYRVVVD